MKSGKRRKRQRQRQEESSSAAAKKSRKKSESNTASSSSSENSKAMKALIFQEAMERVGKSADDDEEDVSNVFFELANSPMVGFRIERDKGDGSKDSDKTSGPAILVQQNIGTTAHTGGIVWETAYLLLQYLLSTSSNNNNNTKLGKTLEVGSGCGLLGQVLAAHKLADEVVMTEHEIVMKTGHMAANLERNEEILRRGSPCYMHNLDWENYQRDTKQGGQHLEPHSFDTVVGTDVVFTPKLVEPLWETLQYMSHSKTNIYLCLQERCEASHKLLLQKASSFNFQMDDITNQLDELPSCKWGLALECRLFHIRVKQKA